MSCDHNWKMATSLQESFIYCTCCYKRKDHATEEKGKVHVIYNNVTDISKRILDKRTQENKDRS